MPASPRTTRSVRWPAWPRCIQVPEAPGLGIEIDETAAARHPFRQEILAAGDAVLPDGTVVDW